MEALFIETQKEMSFSFQPKVFMTMMLSIQGTSEATDRECCYTRNEQQREKTNILLSDLVRHKPGCTATEKMARGLKFHI